MGKNLARLAVVGSGYVGTVVAAGLAHVGRQVVVLEIDQRKLSMLRSGRPPFFEPGLEEMLRAGIANGRLTFTDDAVEAVAEAEVVIMCLGTPPGPNGRPDLTTFRAAAVAVGSALGGPTVLVNKSTVPVGTGQMLAEIVRSVLPPSLAGMEAVSVVSCPEFLREGNAVDDFMHPYRLVLGSEDPDAIDRVAEVYRPILDQSFEGGQPHLRPPLVRTTLVNAEMIKYASNAFLATKISFINEIANICERVGANVTEVSAAMGLDPRIGSKFLNAGAGWGGSCFGKDLHALVALASDVHYDAPLLGATLSVNHGQRVAVVDKLRQRLHTLQGKQVTILGIAFKPGTDDVRDAPALDVAAWLLAAGSSVRAHDPMVTSLPDLPGVAFGDDACCAAAGSDAVVLLTEWPQYAALDLGALRQVMRGDVFIDARNFLNPDAARAAGLAYEGFGGPVPGGDGVPEAVIHAVRTIRLELDELPLPALREAAALEGNGSGLGI